MASRTDDGKDGSQAGVDFIEEEDDTITAQDLETGLARGGDSRAEALAQLAEVLELHECGGEPIDNPDEFLRDELGIEPPKEEKSLPDFLQ